MQQQLKGKRKLHIDHLSMLRRQRSCSDDWNTVVPPHLTCVKDLSKELVDALLRNADEMRNTVRVSGGSDRLKNRVLATIFYEPSTRTNCSFQAAMLRLGGQVINLDNAMSSSQKGETIEDTIQTMSCYCDCIVIRHPMKGSAALAASVASKPVINAGDGTGEHPTQALLDVYTIKAELGYLGLNPKAQSPTPTTVTLLGDLKNGRTVHSLVKLLALYPGIRLVYVSPPQLAMPEEIVAELRAVAPTMEQLFVSDLQEAVKMSDVLYVTRIQKERFSSVDEYSEVAGSYVINKEVMKDAKQKMVVMHPLPRNAEISVDFDDDPRAAYFRQMENGMFMRMAILDIMIKSRDLL